MPAKRKKTVACKQDNKRAENEQQETRNKFHNRTGCVLCMHHTTSQIWFTCGGMALISYMLHFPLRRSARLRQHMRNILVSSSDAWHSLVCLFVVVCTLAGTQFFSAFFFLFYFFCALPQTKQPIQQQFKMLANICIHIIMSKHTRTLAL